MPSWIQRCKVADRETSRGIRRRLTIFQMNRGVNDFVVARFCCNTSLLVLLYLFN